MKHHGRQGLSLSSVQQSARHGEKSLRKLWRHQRNVGGSPSPFHWNRYFLFNCVSFISRITGNFAWMFLFIVYGPFSLFNQPGPREFPIQCFIKRDRATSVYRLYFGLTPCMLFHSLANFLHTFFYFVISFLYGQIWDLLGCLAPMLIFACLLSYE